VLSSHYTGDACPRLRHGVCCARLSPVALTALLSLCEGSATSLTVLLPALLLPSTASYRGRACLNTDHDIVKLMSLLDEFSPLTNIFQRFFTSSLSNRGQKLVYIPHFEEKTNSSNR
jgi:hypothetical protein